MNEIILPQSGKSNEIGRMAIKALRASSPDSWDIDESSREEDNAGIDLSVQVIQDGYHRQSFQIQAKGSARMDENGVLDALNKSEEHFSVQLESSVLNYYARIGAPVMLTFTDLTSAEKTRDCKTFYLWIDDDLRRLLRGRVQIPSEQGSHAFHVPVDQLITDQLDVLPYLDSRESARGLGRDLVAVVAEKVSEKPLNAASGIISSLESREVAIPTLLEDDCERPWLRAPESSIASSLEKSAKFLEFGKVMRADEILSDLEKPGAPRLEGHFQAEIHYQRGRILEFGGYYEEAERSYLEATRFSSASIYDSAWCEAQLVIREKSDLQSLLEHSAEKSGKSYRFLRAKIFALQGDCASALAEAEGLEGADAYLCRALSYFMTGQSRECKDSAEKGLQEDGTLIQQMSLYLLLARSLFDTGLPAAMHGQKLPFGGLPEMSPERMRRAWEAALSCWEIGQEIGYPGQIELLGDISVHLATYFQETELLLPKLLGAARKHPGRPALQDLALSLAQFLGREDLIEEFIEKLPATSLAKVFHQAALLLRHERKSEFLSLIEDHLEELAAVEGEDHRTLIEYAGLIATEQGRTASANKFLDKLPDKEASAEFIQCAVSLARNPLDREESIARLWRLFLGGRRDFSMCTNLFWLLNPQEAEDADRLLHLYESFEGFRALSLDELLKLCVAAVTLRKWSTALDLCDSLEQRFGVSDRSCQVRAFALDHLGDTPGALALLEEVCADPVADSESLRTLAHIAARCGLLDKAFEMLEKISERSEDQRGRKNTLLAMFEIEVLRDLRSPRLHWIWKEIGEVVDRQDEIDEGNYLLLTLAFGHYLHPFSSDEELESLQERHKEYYELFPDSRVLKRFLVPAELKGLEILELLDQQIGIPQEVKQNRRQLAEAIRRGHLAIPYSIRHHFLPECANTLELFQATLDTDKCAKGYQLCVDSKTDDSPRFQQLASQIPLLDEVSLLVLHELNLIPRLMEVFPRVAIPVSIISRLHRAHLGPNPTTMLEVSRSLFAELARFSGRIHQVPLPSSGSTNLAEIAELQGMRAILKAQPDFMLFSDDALARQLVLEESMDERWMATPDLLEILRGRGWVSSDMMVAVLGRYCSWNVAGISLRYLDILRPLQKEVGVGDSPKDILAKIETEVSVRAFLDVAWIPADRNSAGHLPESKALEEYSRLREAGSGLVAFMLAGSSLEEMAGGRIVTSTITGFWLAWYHRMRTALPSSPDPIEVVGTSIVESAWCASRMCDRSDLGRRVWKTFFAAWEFIKGESMDQQAERELIRCTATILARQELGKVRDRVYEVLASGFVDGTAESDLLRQYYNRAVSERIQQ